MDPQITPQSDSNPSSAPQPGSLITPSESSISTNASIPPQPPTVNSVTAPQPPEAGQSTSSIISPATQSETPPLSQSSPPVFDPAPVVTPPATPAEIPGPVPGPVVQPEPDNKKILLITAAVLVGFLILGTGIFLLV